MDENRKKALTLMQTLWNSIDWKKFPKRNLLRVYSIFQDWIQSSAYTSSLDRFIASFTEHANALAVPNVKEISEILHSGDHYEILRLLREETPALMIYMRASRENSKMQKTEATKNVSGGENSGGENSDRKV